MAYSKLSLNTPRFCVLCAMLCLSHLSCHTSAAQLVTCIAAKLQHTCLPRLNLHSTKPHRLLLVACAYTFLLQALAVMAQPSYVPASLHELFLLSDEIWHLAGDTAVDSSWYTKRATLSAIYSSAEVFMTTDTSPGFAETENFLDRRLHELQTMGQTLGAVSEWVGFSGRALVNVLRSKGVRI